MKSRIYGMRNFMKWELLIVHIMIYPKKILLLHMQNLILYLQPIITQYFIDNKSEIWLLFLIAHSKR